MYIWLLILLFCRVQPFLKAEVQEQENWTRLSYLLINQGTLSIRKIITDKLDEWQLEFKQLVTANKRNIKKSDLLFENQKRLLLKNTQNDVIEKCDLTLLILLVGFFNVLPNPPRGWRSQKEPEPNDLDPSSDVLRLRLMRNKLYHTVQCAIPQADFEKRWAKGTEVLNRLNALPSAMDQTKLRKFVVVERTYYVKAIRVQFSSDRPDAEEFIKESIKEERLIAMPQAGLSTGEKGICSKCNKSKRALCSDCTDVRQSSPQPGPSIGEKQPGFSVGEKQPGLSVGEKQSGLSVGEKVKCSKCHTPVCSESIMCNDCSGCSKCDLKKDGGN